MAQLPGGSKKDIFTVPFDGVYGRFKTTESFELGYLLTNLRSHELDRLVTASKAFDFRTITFEEVIQRDIDMERVDKEIVKKYLECGHNRVLFFPPILVSIVAMEKGQRIDTYKSVHSEYLPDSGVIRRTWDQDKFQLELNRSDTPTGYQVTVDDVQHPYFPYAATIKVNPETVKLVVIDGQHRFMALKRILEDSEKKGLLADLEVPVCIFFTPDAIEDHGHAESIKRDLRDLFVTINSTAKTVGGHFIVLLDDKSLASLAVRCLANNWKDTGSNSLLPLLEWNTREANKSRQRQKPFSITTVTVIADVFSKYIFSRPETVEDLFNLSAIRDELKVSPTSPAYNAIDEESFGQEQIEVLKARFNDWLVPALNVLLQEPRPYAKQIDGFKKALEGLEEKIQANVPAAAAYRDEVLFQFRRCVDNDYASVKTAEIEFESSIGVSDYDQVYFLNVFQQGLLRAWASLSVVLVKELAVKPEIIARAMMPTLQRLVFNDSKCLLIKSNSYLQPLLFEGEKVRVNETSRLQWQHLILATFYSKEAQKLFGKELKVLIGDDSAGKIAAAIQRVGSIATDALSEYLRALEDRLKDDFERNWKFKELDKEVMRYLMDRENDPERYEEYEGKIGNLVVEKLQQAKISLSNVLGIAVEEI